MLGTEVLFFEALGSESVNLNQLVMHYLPFQVNVLLWLLLFCFIISLSYLFSCVPILGHHLFRK